MAPAFLVLVGSAFVARGNDLGIDTKAGVD
jgi:hypothetical protein